MPKLVLKSHVGGNGHARRKKSGRKGQNRMKLSQIYNFIFPFSLGNKENATGIKMK